jgi:C1A family cysteine protease
MNFTLGAIRSPHDDKDLIAEHIYPKIRDLTLPEELDLRPSLQKVRDQGSQSSCVAQASACMKEWQERKEVNLNTYMSPQFIYNNRHNYPSDGMILRDAMTILNTTGSCLETTYSYGTIETADKIKPEAFTEAAKYKIKQFARVGTIDALKTALYTNGPCIIAFPVYNFSSEFWKQQKPTEKVDGGHCVAIVGYTKDAFIIRNSWGTDWGSKGYTYYPFSDFGLHWEIWTSIDDASPIPNPQPQPVPDPTTKTGCLGALLQIFKKK